ncbi:uncharacterized protein [Salvelinus alpinus]|uniref:uncharacterized protein isoform X3 n=1 Tax=Salvelinus alpinus TaxID=8036 RepID=UPI0039FD3B22
MMTTWCGGVVMWVVPELVGQALATVLMLVSLHWFVFLLNLPVAAWNMYSGSEDPCIAAPRAWTPGSQSGIPLLATDCPPYQARKQKVSTLYMAGFGRCPWETWGCLTPLRSTTGDN